jgi:hypothetical protein
MDGTNKGIVPWMFLCSILVFTIAGAVRAEVHEPPVLVYPNSAAVFRYDATRYELLEPSNSNYDPNFAIAGRMLWDKVDDRVPIEIYRAPNLAGFEENPLGFNEFVSLTNQFVLIIDGFYDQPRHLGALYIRFIPDPPQSLAQITMNGADVTSLIQPIEGFDASTPIAGGYYTGTKEVHIAWSGPMGMRVSAYVDKNGNGVYDGGLPPFSVYVRDNTVPTVPATLGRVKALYSR